MWKAGMIALTLVLVLGCQYLAPIGPIMQLGVMWMNGEAHKYYNTDQETIAVAMREVLKKLDLPIVSEEEDGEILHIRAGDKDRFKIKLNAVRERTTKVSIRVNTMGDKEYAEMIYRHLDSKAGVVQFMSLKELNTAMERRRRN